MPCACAKGLNMSRVNVDKNWGIFTKKLCDKKKVIKKTFMAQGELATTMEEANMDQNKCVHHYCYEK